MNPILMQIDAFTPRLFAGNSAGVCVLETPRDTVWMQSVAHELNLPETAFLREGREGWNLSWFTPTVESDFSGHATLAAAHLLWELNLLNTSQPAQFHTRGGMLTASKDGNWIGLDFPAKPVHPAMAPYGLLEALGLAKSGKAIFIARNPFDYLVVVESEAALRTIEPNYARLALLPTRGVIVTAPADGASYDFASRFFAPRVGVNEDPATGSTHCALGPFWAGRLGKRSLVGFQASARGGIIRVEVRGDRVLLSGQAVTFLQGQLAGGERESASPAGGK